MAAPDSSQTCPSNTYERPSSTPSPPPFPPACQHAHTYLKSCTATRPSTCPLHRPSLPGIIGCHKTVKNAHKLGGDGSAEFIRGGLPGGVRCGPDCGARQEVGEGGGGGARCWPGCGKGGREGGRSPLRARLWGVGRSEGRGGGNQTVGRVGVRVGSCQSYSVVLRMGLSDTIKPPPMQPTRGHCSVSLISHCSPCPSLFLSPPTRGLSPSGFILCSPCGCLTRVGCSGRSRQASIPRQEEIAASSPHARADGKTYGQLPHVSRR